jgi:hypothetical protein
VRVADFTSGNMYRPRRPNSRLQRWRPMAPPGALAAILSVAIASPLAGHAAEWTFVTRASLSETWTDNITLAADGLEESDRITGFRPGFSLGLDAHRARLQLDYDLQALRFADNSDYDDAFHQLYGTGNLELAPETLFLDTFARYDQQNIDISGRVAYDNIFQTGNRTDAAVFGASPYHVGRWGRWAESRVRYEYQATRFADTDATTVDVQDADINAISASLGSPATSRFSWKASGSYSRTEFDEAPEFEFGRAALDVGIPVGSGIRLTGTAGRESDVEEDRTAGGLDATFWYVGLAWQPNEQQSFDVRIGDRYYGTAWEFNYTRRDARGELALGYAEDPTTANGLLGRDDIFVPHSRPGGAPTLNTRVFLQKRLSGRAAYDFVHSRISARIYAEERTYNDAAGDKERVYGTLFNYDWDVAQRTTLGVNIDWERRDLPHAVRQDDCLDLGVRVTHAFTRILSISLRANHFMRTSDRAAWEYSSNRATLQVQALF